MRMIFAAANIGDSCTPTGSKILTLPHWYKYLSGVQDGQDHCVPQLTRLSDTWLVVAALIDILLRVAALAAVAMIVYGGFIYVTSQGDPEKVKKGKNTLINALTGLAIAITASATVTFIAGSIK